jgi:hypothetical protein
VIADGDHYVAVCTSDEGPELAAEVALAGRTFGS